MYIYKAFLSAVIVIVFTSCYREPDITPMEETQSIATATANSSFSPTPHVDKSWFGMQISSDLWQAEEIHDALYQRGLLTHLTLESCRAWILSEDPVFISGYTPDWTTSTLEPFKTTEIRLDLRKVKDQNGSLRDIYFEVYDTTGRTGFDEIRLAYFLVETGADPIQCLEAVHTVLITIKPGLFPDLDVGQG